MECRRKSLNEKFLSIHNNKPDGFVRAPGRVNLIGEHIDYCGYSVLPMALERNVLIAFKKNDSDILNISNLDDKYPAFSCNINHFSIDGTIPLWYKYVLCGIQGIKDNYPESLPGMDLVIDGNIPPGAGLSSSSALVCASALATKTVIGFNIEKDKMADICAAAERYIGTQGGGMDQAACLLSSKGMAMKINFNPLTTENTLLPTGAVFVIGNSLVVANKAATSSYNCRVMECRLAARVIAVKAGIKDKINDDTIYLKLKNLQLTLNKSLEEMINMVKLHLHPEPYTQKEICSLLNIQTDYLQQNILSENTKDIQEFQLHDRALHVFSEALRVQQFKDLCDALSNCNNSSVEDTEKTLQSLGNIMNQSHESTRSLYCCSHPKLDTLVELAQTIAYGARLTGAGWGGCMVALVAENKLEEFHTVLRRKYYDHEESAKNKEEKFYLFSTVPEDGATVINNNF